MKNIKDNRILDSSQKLLLEKFQETPLASKFYLSGGTALAAFYLEHRFSEDLDFFCLDDFPVEPILEFLHSLPDVSKIDFERKFDRRLFLLLLKDKVEVKVEFTKYPFKRSEKIAKVENLLVDSLYDILLNKLLAMSDRRDPKDYFDIFCIFKKEKDLKLNKAAKDAEKKFGINGLKYILQSKFMEKIDLSGIRSLNTFDPSEIISFFRESVKRI